MPTPEGCTRSTSAHEAWSPSGLSSCDRLSASYPPSRGAARWPPATRAPVAEPAVAWAEQAPHEVRLGRGRRMTQTGGAESSRSHRTTRPRSRSGFQAAPPRGPRCWPRSRPRNERRSWARCAPTKPPWRNTQASDPAFGSRLRLEADDGFGTAGSRINAFRVLGSGGPCGVRQNPPRYRFIDRC
jgi:hypothetical protein